MTRTMLHDVAANIVKPLKLSGPWSQKHRGSFLAIFFGELLPGFVQNGISPFFLKTLARIAPFDKRCLRAADGSLLYLRTSSDYYVGW